MNENGSKENGTTFSILSFERKLAELVEELRIKRNLEKENEKNIESILNEKYEAELSFDEQKRNFAREKESLVQQIDILKRKLEDKVCVSTDKDKLQVMNKTYSYEIRELKEELRASKSEALTLQKNLQEAEGKLTLHKNFQDSIMSQVSEVQNMTKSIMQEVQDLKTFQTNIMQNISNTMSLFQKYDICNQHQQQIICMFQRKIEALKRKLISQKSQFIITKNLAAEERNRSLYTEEIEKQQQKILEQDKQLLMSRRENEKTLSNFLESNKLLSQIMDRYAELQQKEKSTGTELGQLRYSFEEAKAKLHQSQEELRNLQEKILEKVTLSVTTQTEETRQDASPEGPTSMDFVEAARCDLALLQKSAVSLQTEKMKDSVADTSTKKENNGESETVNV